MANPNFKGAWEYLLARLTERSTWIGLVGIGTAFGMAITSELAESIAIVGAAVAGSILVLTKDVKDE